MIKSIFDIYGTAILAGLFLVLFILESQFQLRRRIQSRWKRIFINVIVSIPSFALLRFLFIPAVLWISTENEQWQFGISYWLQLPLWIEFAIAFCLLDYSNYIWHVLLHKLPLLWRFHLVHHTDLDLDVTTAFRFHFGELIGSVMFRGAAILLTGASPLLVLIYEIAFEAATQFHHSNLRLPLRFERLLQLIIVTPRMHGIHHSMIKDETDSNYSVIFSVWDWIHKTIKTIKVRREVVTGVPSYSNEKELTVGNLWLLPFRTVRKWTERDTN